jgi:hypothetical protein
MANAATEGFSIIVESMIEMMGTILTKALGPIMTGAVNGIVNGIVNGLGSLFGFGGGGGSSSTSVNEDYASDLKQLINNAGGNSVGASSVMDQFGYTMITGNKASGNYAGSLSTSTYSGSPSSAQQIVYQINFNGDVNSEAALQNVIEKVMNRYATKTSGAL